MHSIRKRVTLTGGLVLCAFLSTGCFEGYIGPDGEPLLDYLAPEDLRELTVNPQPDKWIIDVRPSEAYEAGHIPTARSFPSSTIGSRLDDLPLEQYLIVQCETGGRAQAVILDVLEPNGYTRFMNWGGVIKWTNAGYELVTD
jgi:rhodanese-related sulfurtransferase